MQKSQLLEVLEIVTCLWGGWVSKEVVTISKKTFRVVLYSLRRPSGSGSFAPPPPPPPPPPQPGLKDNFKEGMASKKKVQKYLCNLIAEISL